MASALKGTVKAHITAQCVRIFSATKALLFCFIQRNGQVNYTARGSDDNSSLFDSSDCHVSKAKNMTWMRCHFLFFFPFCIFCTLLFRFSTLLKSNLFICLWNINFYDATSLFWSRGLLLPVSRWRSSQFGRRRSRTSRTWFTSAGRLRSCHLSATRTSFLSMKVRVSRKSGNSRTEK